MMGCLRCLYSGAVGSILSVIALACCRCALSLEDFTMPMWDLLNALSLLMFLSAVAFPILGIVAAVHTWNREKQP